MERGTALLLMVSTGYSMLGFLASRKINFKFHLNLYGVGVSFLTGPG